jgi:two-component system, response regulator
MTDQDPKQAGRHTVLLVEDNPDDELLTLRAFRKSKLANQVHIARDGVEALDYLLGRSEDGDRWKHPLPHLVLLDLKLPKVDGLEVLKRLRGEARTRVLPVVVLTSSDEERDLVESYMLGANSYIRKPVAFEEFTRVIEEVGLYWLIINLAPDPPPVDGGTPGTPDRER